MRRATTGGGGAEPRQGSESAADAHLLACLRKGDVSAFREFVRRFRPLLLDQARRLRVDPGERETTVETFFDDIVIRLVDSTPPRSLAAYVVQSFRNDVLQRRRSVDRHDMALVERAEETGGVSVLRETCSSYSVRAVIGVHGIHVDGDPVLTRLGEHLASRMSEGDRRIIQWRSDGVPTRDIAGWLGVGYGAARVRISRVRVRLVAETMSYRETLPAAERGVLDRFLRRAGVVLPGGDESRDDPEDAA